MKRTPLIHAIINKHSLILITNQVGPYIGSYVLIYNSFKTSGAYTGTFPGSELLSDNPKLLLFQGGGGLLVAPNKPSCTTDCMVLVKNKKTPLRTNLSLKRDSPADMLVTKKIPSQLINPKDEKTN